MNAGQTTFQTVARAIAFAALGIVATLAFVPSSGAQEHVRVTIDQVVLGDDGVATAYLSALDAAGRPVGGITEVDASVDGEASQVGAVQPIVGQGVGISVLLALDVSGSMDGEPIARAKEAAIQFLQGLSSQDSVAVLSFAGAVELVQPFTVDRALAEAAIIRLIASGPTALYQAIADSLRFAAEQGGGRKAVVLLSDGLDTSSPVTRDDTIAAASASGVPFYTVGLGAADLAFLQELAYRAGGQLYQAPQPADLQRMFEEVSSTLRSQYAIAIRLPASQRTQRELLVGVAIQGQRYAARYVFQAPASAPPAPPATAAAPVSETPASTAGFQPGYLLIAAALGLIIGVGAVHYVLRRRRRRHSTVEPGPGADDAPLPAPETPRFVSTSLGRLNVVAGPNAGAGVALSTGAITLGSDPTCDLRLDQANGSVAAVHVRVWLEHDRLMLHHLAKRARTIVGDRPVDWATLEANDTLQIGPHIIVFALDSVTATPSRSA